MGEDSAFQSLVAGQLKAALARALIAYVFPTIGWQLSTFYFRDCDPILWGADFICRPERQSEPISGEVDELKYFETIGMSVLSGERALCFVLPPNRICVVKVSKWTLESSRTPIPVA